MINPSALDLSALPWLPLEAKSAFPRQPAIYFAIDAQNVIQYIGRSVNPKVRWAGHHRYEQLTAIGRVRVAYLFVDSPELLPSIESALIEWFDPPLNVAGKTACLAETVERGSIVNKVAELRKRENLTQLELAQAVGVTESTIANWEQGRNSTKWFERIARLCAKLNCTPDQLIEYVEAVQDEVTDEA